MKPITQELKQQLQDICPFKFNQDELDAILSMTQSAYEECNWVEEHDFPYFTDMIAALEDYKNRRYTILVDKCYPLSYGASHVVLRKPKNVFDKELSARLIEVEQEYRAEITSQQDSWLMSQVEDLLTEQEAAAEEAAQLAKQSQRDSLRALLSGLLV